MRYRAVDICDEILEELLSAEQVLASARVDRLQGHIEGIRTLVLGLVELLEGRGGPARASGCEE
jgi:hypothetical protein